jgi:glycosyltransferase involved in cell wall biosynthesis
MIQILIAIGCAALAACFFAAAVRLQHGAVRATNVGESLGVSTLGRVVRTPRWLGGTALAVTGSALHITALSLAPLAIVQPIGVLSLVLTVLPGARANGIRKAVFAVCAGVGGFVVLAASAGAAPAATAPGWSAQFIVVGALALAAAGMATHGRARCLALATSAAVFFGLGSALIRAASGDILGGGAFGSGLLLAAEAVVLMVSGGWLMHQAYAAGPTGIVVAATTVIDPLTAVTVGLAFYGEAAHTTPATAFAQAGLALAAVAGVLVLARSVPDPRDLKEKPDMPITPPPGQRLRILISADTFPPDVNGAAHFADRLARGLAARGHDVHVVCPANTPKPTVVSDGQITVHRIKSLGTPFHPSFRICAPWQASRAAPALFDQIQPDVVHVQSHFSIGRAVLTTAHERGIPAIATNHFMPENLLGYAPVPQPLRGPIARWAWRDLVRVYRQADFVTAPTPRAVELLEANGLPGAQAVSCGIDVSHYASGERSTGPGMSVLFVGRLDKEKNVDELIRAMVPLPDVRADIVGDGSCREKLVALAADLGVLDRIRFHGFVSDEDLVRAYQRCDVFCMPGTAELQSLATMEAMAAGLPVIAADAMALPHLARPGINGFLYPPGDIDRLTAYLAELAHDPAIRTELGRASRKIIAGHGIERTLDVFSGLYHEAVDARHPSVALAS